MGRKGKLTEAQKAYRRTKHSLRAGDKHAKKQAEQDVIAHRQAAFDQLSPAHKEARQTGKARGKYLAA